MARQSKYIFYDINESHLQLKLGEFTFVFSSDNNMQRFIDQYIENRESLKWVWSSRMGVEFDSVSFFDITLYSKIERRGFKIITKDGDVITCLELTKLDGKMKTKENSQD